MGFLDFMGKMINGKPVFNESGDKKELEKDGWEDGLVPKDPESDPYAHTPQGQTINESDTIRRGRRIDSTGNKIIPVLRSVHTQTKRVGAEDMEVWTKLRNESNFPILVDKIAMIGQHQELDRIIEPGQQFEFRVFNGPMPDNDNYSTAELYYRDNESGDYFLAKHFIRYKVEANGKCSVSDLSLQYPIQDY